jgi:hypothetical protein
MWDVFRTDIDNDCVRGTKNSIKNLNKLKIEEIEEELTDKWKRR